MHLPVTAALLLSPLLIQGQDTLPHQVLPLVITGSATVPLSAAGMEKAIHVAWERTFAQEPGAHLIATDPRNGQLQGAARFNFKSTAPNSRLTTLGVIEYQVSIEAENGLCRIRVGGFTHWGNKHAPGGPVNLGRIYGDQRPPERIAGVSKGTADRLHQDMRQQVSARVRTLINLFIARLRQAAEQE